VRDIGGEVQRIAFAQLLFVSLGAQDQRPPQADHELLRAGGMSGACVAHAGLQADLECLEAAIAAVDVEQATAHARLEGEPLAIGAADEVAADGAVLGEQRADGDVECARDAPQGLQRRVAGARLDGGQDGLG
jgi:hypothetical protein